MNPLDLVKLTALMELSSGKPEISIGLIDGPVYINHPDLFSANIREIPGRLSGTCSSTISTACMHGTFVAGILCAKRNSIAPAICPQSTLLLRPIFAETNLQKEEMPTATPDELAEAIIDCIHSGARVINLSAAIAQQSSQGERKLEEALDYAARRGVIIVAAAGNQGTVGGSVITRHPWVIPVVACDLRSKPIHYSNLGRSIGRRGLSAPGENIRSLGVQGEPLTLAGTSIAAPFVAGAIALLWSQFSDATAASIKLAITQAYAHRRATIVPPLLDAWAAYQIMAMLTKSKEQAS